MKVGGNYFIADDSDALAAAGVPSRVWIIIHSRIVGKNRDFPYHDFVFPIEHDQFTTIAYRCVSNHSSKYQALDFSSVFQLSLQINFLSM